MDELNLHLEDMGSEMKVMGAASTIYSPASWERCWGKKKKNILNYGKRFESSVLNSNTQIIL